MNKIDIGTLLASLIHESKNSVGNLMHQLQTVTTSFSGNQDERDKIAHIENDLKRLNDDWVEYLYLYKLAYDGYDIQYQTQLVDEFLDDQVFILTQAAKEKDINLTYECQEGMLAIFDERLLISVMSTGVYNSLRFAKKSIQLKAEKNDQFLIFSIEDDGCGFVETPLEEGNELSENFNTSLGLYFAELSAQSHINNGIAGYIEKSISANLGGASLKIYLPQ